MASRLIYFTAGVAALYLAAAPRFSGFPNTRPGWFTFVLWLGAICLIVSATRGSRNRVNGLAAVGSAFGVSLYVYFAIVQVFRTRLGIGHIQGRLVAVHENSFDQWRLLLDKPVFYLLLLTSIASLAIVIRSWKLESKQTIRTLN